MSLPTIVLVHGAWHTPANYAGFTDALKAQGFPVHCPLLPSCTKSLQPEASLQDDIQAVRKLVSSLVAAGERILMIMHSYGGAVGSEAVHGLAYPHLQPDLLPQSQSQSQSTPTASSQPGGVIHLLYLCAYFLPRKTSVWDIVLQAGFGQIFDQYVETAPDGSTFPLDPGLIFFGGDDGVPRAKIDEALTTLVRFPRSALTTAVPNGAAFALSIPRTYVATQKDYSVPRAYQDIMMRMAQEQGLDVKMHDFNTRHSIFVSRETEMVQLAVEAARDERNSPVSWKRVLGMHQ